MAVCIITEGIFMIHNGIGYMYISNHDMMMADFFMGILLMLCGGELVYVVFIELS